MIDFPCPACGKRLCVKPALAGKDGRCRSCGSIVRVPPKSISPPAPKRKRTHPLILGGVSVAAALVISAAFSGPRARPVVGGDSDGIAPPATRSARSAPPGYHVGPRGGVYRYSRGGRKVYDSKR